MAKRNSKTIKWVSAICGIVVIILALAGLIWAAATQNANFETSKTKQGEMCADIDANATEVQKVKTDVAVMKTDIKYIREGVDRNAVTQQKILEEIRK